MCSSLKITRFSSHSKFQTSAAAIQEPIGSTSATTMALGSLPMTWIRHTRLFPPPPKNQPF